MRPNGTHRVNGASLPPSGRRGGPNAYRRLARSFNAIYQIIGSKQRVSEADLKKEQTLRTILAEIDEFVMVLQSFLYKTDNISFASRQTGIFLFRESANRKLMAAFEDPVKGPKILKAFKEAMLAMASIGIIWRMWPFRDLYINSISKLAAEPSQQVLEIGAGIEGMGFIHFESLLKQHQTLLLDKDPFVCDLLSTAVRQNQIGHIEVARSDILDFSPANRKFDVIFATLLLRYLPKDRRLGFFKKMKELASDTAHIIIVDSAYGLDDQSMRADLETHSAAVGFSDKSSGTFPGPNGQPAFLYVLVPA